VSGTWDPDERIAAGRIGDPEKAKSLVRAACGKHKQLVGHVRDYPGHGAVFRHTRADPPWNPSIAAQRGTVDRRGDTWAAVTDGTPAMERLAREGRQSIVVSDDLEGEKEPTGWIRAECPAGHDVYFELAVLRTKARVARRAGKVQRAVALT
jgi:hypothetical protein